MGAMFLGKVIYDDRSSVAVDELMTARTDDYLTGF